LAGLAKKERLQNASKESEQAYYDPRRIRKKRLYS
jgi:hypothetical protein